MVCLLLTRGSHYSLLVHTSFLLKMNSLQVFWGSLPQFQNIYFAKHISVVASNTYRSKFWNLFNPFATTVLLKSTDTPWKHHKIRGFLMFSESGILVENCLINFFYCIIKMFVIGLALPYLQLHIYMKNTRSLSLCKKKVRRILNSILGTSKTTMVCCSSSWNIVVSARSFQPEAAIESCSLHTFTIRIEQILSEPCDFRFRA